MKKRVTLILAFLCTLLMFTSCATVPITTLNSVQTEDVTLALDRGQEYQYVTNKNVSVMASATEVDGKEGGVILSLLNNRKDIMNFYDSDVEILGGNVDTDQWTSIGSWSAQNYYQKAVDEAASSEFWTAFAGALSVASAAMGEYSSSNVYTPYGSATVYTHTYDPTDVLLTSMLASSTIRDVKNINKQNIDWLHEHLLYSTHINPNTEYTGIMFFDASDYPDYKIRLHNATETPIDFTYQRSDRKEIINPWLDRSKPRHSVALNYGLPESNLGIMYLWSQPKGVGAYAGLTLRGLFNKGIDSAGTNYSSYSFYCSNSFEKKMAKLYGIPGKSNYVFNDEFNKTSGIMRTTMEMPFGMTIKAFPHSWIMLGGSFGYAFKNYEKGYVSFEMNNTQYTYPEEVWVERTVNESIILYPQIGMNFIFNMIDVYALAGYDFLNKKVTFDFGIGYAF